MTGIGASHTRVVALHRSMAPPIDKVTAIESESIQEKTSLSAERKHVEERRYYVQSARHSSGRDIRPGHADPDCRRQSRKCGPAARLSGGSAGVLAFRLQRRRSAG